MSRWFSAFRPLRPPSPGGGVFFFFFFFFFFFSLSLFFNSATSPSVDITFSVDNGNTFKPAKKPRSSSRPGTTGHYRRTTHAFAGSFAQRARAQGDGARALQGGIPVTRDSIGRRSSAMKGRS